MLPSPAPFSREEGNDDRYRRVRCHPLPDNMTVVPHVFSGCLSCPSWTGMAILSLVNYRKGQFSVLVCFKKQTFSISNIFIFNFSAILFKKFFHLKAKRKSKKYSKEKLANYKITAFIKCHLQL